MLKIFTNLFFHNHNNLIPDVFEGGDLCDGSWDAVYVRVCDCDGTEAEKRGWEACGDGMGISRSWVSSGAFGAGGDGTGVADI
jgi:hypothetical protein